MRTLMLLVAGTLLLSAATIDKTIDEIFESREPTMLKVPSYDPFKRVKPLLKQKESGKAAEKPKPLRLAAVFNGKANINGKWYRVGEMTPIGRVVKMTPDNVWIKRGNKTTVMRLNRAKSPIEIKEHL